MQDGSEWLFIFMAHRLKKLHSESDFNDTITLCRYSRGVDCAIILNLQPIFITLSL